MSLTMGNVIMPVHPWLYSSLVVAIQLLLFTVSASRAAFVPPGCVEADGTQQGEWGYATRIIHTKTGIEMALIPSGTFVMGSDAIYSNSQPPHEVSIRHPFYMALTELTNGQYREFVNASGYNGAPDTDPEEDLCLRHWGGESLMSTNDAYPVVWVSWSNAQAFCSWSGLELPTEAEWEYACRSGAGTLYYYGNDQNMFTNYGWTVFNSDALTHPVEQKTPNAWGLYDMLGNVWEWALDDYVYRYEGAPTNGMARIEGRWTKVVRGGGWGVTPQPISSSCAVRFNYAPNLASNNIGFRVILRIGKLRGALFEFQ